MPFSKILFSIMQLLIGVMVAVLVFNYVAGITQNEIIAFLSLVAVLVLWVGAFLIVFHVKIGS